MKKTLIIATAALLASSSALAGGLTTNWMASGLNRIDTYRRKNDVIGVALNFAW